jgi:hypothetical protein
MSNIPVPSGPRAPIGHRWVWWIGPPAAITIAYRLLPATIRRIWSRGQSTSHEALSEILSGHGWSAFIRYVVPISLREPWYEPATVGNPPEFVPFWFQKYPGK